MVDAHRQLTEFQLNPFYQFFISVLQAKADLAIISIVSGFTERDLLSLIEREQVIGSTTAYLEFAKLSSSLKEDLALALTEQETK